MAEEKLYEFVTAAKPELTGKKKVDAQVSFMHDGHKVTFNRPSTAQLAVMSTMRSDGEMSLEKLGLFMQLFLGMMDKPTRDYFQPRLMDTEDPMGEIDAPGGILEIFEKLASLWSGKGTQKRSASQPSQRSSGKQSTGSSRARASTS